MSNYRPITDVWILARPKVAYYGAYPNGFLERARVVVGAHIDAPVLHVCGGMVRDYPIAGGFGPNDKTLDMNEDLEPDFDQDANDPFPRGVVHCDDLDLGGDSVTNWEQPWAGILIDRPYSEEDADHYTPGRDVLPPASKLVRTALDVLQPGCKVGILDYEWPRPPKDIPHKLIAAVGVLMGYGNKVRLFTVYERR